jgi:hypothetical protein
MHEAEVFRVRHEYVTILVNKHTAGLLESLFVSREYFQDLPLPVQLEDSVFLGVGDIEDIVFIYEEIPGSPKTAVFLTDEPDGIASDALMFGDDPAVPGNDLVIDLSGNEVFRFNPNPDQHDQYLEAPHDDSLSPLREYTATTWIRWLGVATGADDAFVYAKGTPDNATYALSIGADGQLSASIRRSVHKKCWFWFFGWVDNLCADTTYDETVTLTATEPVPSGEWLHVTATFGGETMRLFLNGENLAEKPTTSTWTSGSYKYQTTTRYLVSNSYPLRIGGEGNADSLAWPTLSYRGLADDIQLFIRALNEDEVLQVYNTGICVP